MPKSAAAQRDRRPFTDEYKREAVRLLSERRAAGVIVGRELDVTPDQLRAWVLQFGESKEPSSHDGSTGDAAEVRRLRRELETLRQERYFLKEAAAFFAKESR